MGDCAHIADTIGLQDPHGLLRGDPIENDRSTSNEGCDESDIPPQNAVSVLPTWNQNKANTFKTLSTFMAFIIMGANDAAYGVSRNRYC